MEDTSVGLRHRKSSKIAQKTLNEIDNHLAEEYYMLGHSYCNNGDYEKIFSCFLTAAKLNHQKAQYNVAVSYENGIGVAISYEKAAEWYKKAALADDKQAKQKLEQVEKCRYNCW
jgi:TPR repeat protein